MSHPGVWERPVLMGKPHVDIKSDQRATFSAVLPECCPLIAKNLVKYCQTWSP